MEGHIVLRLNRSLLVQCILYRMCVCEREEAVIIANHSKDRMMFN
jgi:hypothetical protein